MGYYFLTIGCLFSCVAVWSIYSHLRLWFCGTKTKGTIVDVDERLRRGDSRNKKVYYHPIVEFCDEAGVRHHFTHGGASTRKRPEIGREVPVVYLSPTNARLNTLGGIWVGPIAITIFGATLVYAGIQLILNPPA